MTPEPLKEYRDYLHGANAFDHRLKLLKSAGIYGCNAHGKTNFIKSYKMFRTLIFSETIDIDSYLHDKCGKDQACEFEIEFLLDGTKYRYGFEALHDIVTREWLFYAEPKVRENYLFTREMQEIKESKLWNKMSDGLVRLAMDATQPSQLMLSVLISRQRIPRIAAIAKWFRGNIVMPDMFEKKHEQTAMMILFHSRYRDLILKFLENVQADMGLEPVVKKICCEACKKTTVDVDLMETLNKVCLEERVQFHPCDTHRDFESLLACRLFERESAGALKYFILSCYLAYAIYNKQLVIVDELDTRLHMNTLLTLVKMYNHPEVNYKGSQLIFTTHNTSLLGSKSFRRDQFLMVEKSDGVSSLKKMYDASRPIRAEASMEKFYTRELLPKVVHH